jgi:molybdenum-dependent DNA-binding transcriptional regulator ModE
MNGKIKGISRAYETNLNIMNPSAEKLTPKQEAALLALLDNGTIEAAYKAAGISKATMWRFMQDANFQARYRQARRQLVETAIGQLQKHATTAARVLVNIAVDKDAPASSRVAAAKTILEQSVSAIELMDLQERLERLEELEAARVPEQSKGRFRA